MVRLQGVAWGDLKRSIVGYYELGRDARREVVGAEGVEERQLWKERLRECGIAVGNCLVEMGDLGGARRHFEGLRGRGEGKGNEDEILDARLALISLKLGDVDAARRYLGAKEEATKGEDGKEIIRPLISMADGRYEDAVEEWRALRGGPHDTIAAQNLAVCLLYAGKLDEVRISLLRPSTLYLLPLFDAASSIIHPYPSKSDGSIFHSRFHFHFHSHSMNNLPLVLGIRNGANTHPRRHPHFSPPWSIPAIPSTL